MGTEAISGLVNGQHYDFRCKKCGTYYINYGIMPTLYYYKINGINHGPFCNKCVEKGITINVSWIEDSEGNTSNFSTSLFN